MRTNQRNKRTIYYALYQGVTEITDEMGYYTGEVEITYSEPIKAKMNVSGGRGAADIEMFGIDNPYTRTAVTDDLTTAFDTDTIFWFLPKNSSHTPIAASKKPPELPRKSRIMEVIPCFFNL